MELSLPQEPNLRHDLARGLALEAAKQGSPSEARAFRMCQIRAREEDLKAAMLGASQWYREHYDALRRAGAGFELLASVLNRHLWGYGLRIRVLIRNFLLLTLVIFPGWFYLLRSQLTERQASQIGFADCIYFSVQNMLPAAPSDVIPVSALARGSAALESLLGIIVAGLFVSYLFSWILDQ